MLNKGAIVRRHMVLHEISSAQAISFALATACSQHLGDRNGALQPDRRMQAHLGHVADGVLPAAALLQPAAWRCHAPWRQRRLLACRPVRRPIPIGFAICDPTCNARLALTKGLATRHSGLAGA